MGNELPAPGCAHRPPSHPRGLQDPPAPFPWQMKWGCLVLQASRSASGRGGKEQGEEGKKASFGHGRIEGRGRSICTPLTPRWALLLLLPGCSHHTPWELQAFRLGTQVLPIPPQGSQPTCGAV